MTDSKALLSRILKSPQLPSVPAVAIRLLDLVRDLDSSTRDIVEAIKSDPALVAKVLRAANSSYFSFRSEIQTLEQAVPLIGRTAVTSLSLSFSLSSEAMDGGTMSERYNQYWLQSVVQAVTAELLADHMAADDLSGELFISGLLMDLGQLAMFKVLRNEYLPVVEMQEDGVYTLQHCECEQLGFDHMEAGHALMKQWRFPEAMCQAALYHHHTPDELNGLLENNTRDLVHAMMVASAVGGYFCGNNQGEELARLRELTSSIFGFSEESLAEFLEKVEARVQETGSLLATSTDDLPSAAELMEQACEQLAAISIAQHQQNQKTQLQHQLTELEKVELETQNRELREQAVCDSLTSLYNRRFYDETLRNEVSRARRRGSSIGIIFIDADRFKHLNDTYGHQFGDVVLKGLGSIIRSNTRNTDITARYGGEEFVVLATDATEAGLRILSERIRLAVEAEVFRYEGEVVPVTVSVGAAFASPHRDDENLPSKILEAADAAMYESKRRGRNRTTLHSMATELERRVAQLILECRFSYWLVQQNVIEADVVFDLAKTSRPAPTHIGELACSKKWLDMAGVQQILNRQEVSGERFGTIAHRLGLFSDAQLAILLAEQSECSDILLKQLVDAEIFSRQEAELLLSQFLLSKKNRVETSSENSDAAPSDSQRTRV